jgi:hypothetical protein
MYYLNFPKTFQKLSKLSKLFPNSGDRIRQGFQKGATFQTTFQTGEIFQTTFQTFQNDFLIILKIGKCQPQNFGG